MSDHTAALREAFKAWWSDISRKGDPQHRPNLTAEAYEAGWEDCRIAVLESTPPAPAAPQGDSDEAAEILRNLIANIEENGLYSEEGMLTFLTQALSCLKPANPAPQQPAQVLPEIDFAQEASMRADLLARVYQWNVDIACRRMLEAGWRKHFSGAQQHPTQEQDSKDAAHMALPAKLPEHEWSGDYPSNDSHQEGYAEGWNDCVDAMTATQDAAQGGGNG